MNHFAVKKTSPPLLLTPYRDPDCQVSILVKEWLYINSITDQFIEYPFSPWLLWNYFNRIGLKAVIQKLGSRFAEKARNDKIVGIGVGHVIESPKDLESEIGDPVVFFAPNHDPKSSIAILEVLFVCPVKCSSDVALPRIANMPAAFESSIAWSSYSGKKLDQARISRVLAQLAQKCAMPRLPTDVNLVSYVDHIELFKKPTKATTAVLFGLGNYAKTAILPNIKHYISLQRIHEIDPLQLEFARKLHSVSLDTSPRPRKGFSFDAWFIAGFHHTHADLAIQAIRQGATAVIEKPLATTRVSYCQFIEVLEQIPAARFFLCFHKRYSLFNKFLELDLSAFGDHPIDMHAIVYEIPLPHHHWYNWPNSGSRLISNGCHWIDYFLFVNGYCEIAEYHKWKARSSDVAVQISLQNGAYFTMTLTDAGSQRLGVREHIELRAKGITVTISDAAEYRAENRNRIIRSVRVNPLHAYSQMYQHISRSIALGIHGDSRKSLLSTELTLLLEEQ